jgi:hypothetical protein
LEGSSKKFDEEAVIETDLTIRRFSRKRNRDCEIAPGDVHLRRFGFTAVDKARLSLLPSGLEEALA